jgi:hypothetical protein
MRLAVLCLALPGCKDEDAVQIVQVNLRNTELYQFPTVGGDEEGARISAQAKHFSISEIRRNAETNWVATFAYQPAAGFVGSDNAEIEVLTNSTGTVASARVKTIIFRFTVHE